MVQIKYKGLDKNIKTAIDNMNTLFGYSGFYDSIKRHLKFDMANVPPSWIADLIKSSNIEMSVDFYYSVNPFSNALCYDDPKDATVIHLNKWNLHKSTGSLCNAMMHQCVHAVNAQYPQYSFGHGNDLTEGINNTAPYWIANLAQQIIMKDDSIAESLCHELIVNIPEVNAYYIEQRITNSKGRIAYN